MTCTEVHRVSGFFHGLILSEQDNCKANIIRDNRNFSSTKNKIYLKDGSLNRINANWKTIAYIHYGGEGY